jgi:chemotaxis response regulator CheB
MDLCQGSTINVLKLHRIVSHNMEFIRYYIASIICPHEQINESIINDNRINQIKKIEDLYPILMESYSSFIPVSE